MEFQANIVIVRCDSNLGVDLNYVTLWVRKTIACNKIKILTLNPTTITLKFGSDAQGSDDFNRSSQ